MYGTLTPLTFGIRWLIFRCTYYSLNLTCGYSHVVRNCDEVTNMKHTYNNMDTEGIVFLTLCMCLFGTSRTQIFYEKRLKAARCCYEQESVGNSTSVFRPQEFSSKALQKGSLTLLYCSYATTYIHL